MAHVEIECGKRFEGTITINNSLINKIMFRHLFKLIWNKKKQNFLLISEMLVSFLVIFAVFTLLVYYYQNYRKPMGIEYENVWAVNYSNSYKTENTDSLALFYETLRQMVKSMAQVKEMSFTNDNIPFSQSTNGDGITYGNSREQVDVFSVEDSYKNVLNVKLLEGRWFSKQDVAAKENPVIINETLAKKIFGNDEAVGKLVSFDHDQRTKIKVIGVVEDAKVKGDYVKVDPATFVRLDTGSFHWLGNILIKVTPDADAAFEGRLYKTIANYMKDSNIEIEHLVNKRKNKNYFALVPMIVLLIVAGFLIVNVALGLFGVLWYNINKRRGEIGLRRAIGASGKSVSAQLVGESMILATFSLIIGAFFAMQFPLLNVFDLPASVYLAAIGLSVLFIYLLVLICSLYPGRQAAAIYPAVALHEE
jgi:putative ABC transport system permease protein